MALDAIFDLCAPPNNPALPYKNLRVLLRFPRGEPVHRARILNKEIDHTSNIAPPAAVSNRCLPANLESLFSLLSPRLLYFSAICPIAILDKLS